MVQHSGHRRRVDGDRLWHQRDQDPFLKRQAARDQQPAGRGEPVTGRAAALTLAAMMLVGGVGVASAATGGSFLLGKSNQESSPASLSSSHGAALALSAPKNTAPFSVNRQKMVSNLNPQPVGG